jgi:hypothetical protein
MIGGTRPFLSCQVRMVVALAMYLIRQGYKYGVDSLLITLRLRLPLSPFFLSSIYMWAYGVEICFPPPAYSS